MLTRLVPLGMVLVALGAAAAGCSMRSPSREAREITAIASLRAIGAAEYRYSSTCGNGGYATSLTVLGKAAPGATEAFLPADLTTGDTVTKSQYVLTLSAGDGATAGPADCNGQPTRTAYYAKAEPVTFGESGTRSFAINTGSTVWEVGAATAPREPFGLPAKPVQ